MYKRQARGYQYTEIVEDEYGGVVKRRETQKYEPPNITAIKLWLSCRLPEKWGARVGEADAQDRLCLLYTSVAYWYQEEPHTPFPPLPEPSERWPR